jgi:ABC-type sugar transport system ATPase subunit
MLLELAGIQKRFGGVTALRDGNLKVTSGEVHLLMGENGAGKSTLMKIVAGMQSRDGGSFLWRGQPAHFPTPKDAARAGIAMVHQESLLAPHLSVAENIFLGREESIWAHRKRDVEQARRLIEEHRFPLQPEWRVERLSPAGKQLVEICRAIAQGSSLLIFDEPTSSLSESETQAVFRIVGELKDRGAGVIYITHRLEELRTIGDAVTVLRDGETVHAGPLRDLSAEALIRHMVGRELASVYTRTPRTPGEELLRVRNLTVPPLLRGISLTLHAGEIVGLAGLMGAGRTELCRALFGIDRVASGSVEAGGSALKLRSPRDAVAAGIALIPEDRQRTGLATLLSVKQNTTLASLGHVSRFGVLSERAEIAATQRVINRLRIKTNSPDQQARRLSGGNQQKVVIGKWLERGAKVFLFDEPTRGIDIGAKSEVFQVMDELAAQGRAILMVSSELPELLQVADRILVMRQGEIAGELPRGSTQEEIMRLAAFDAGVQ